MCASSNIAVYEFPGPQNAEAGAVSLKSSLLYLADKFGAGEYYLIGAKDAAVDFIDRVHERESGKPDLLVVLKGVDTPEHLYKDWSPSFQIDVAKKEKLAQGLVKALFRRLPKQVAEAHGANVAHLTDEIKYVSLEDAKHDDLPLQFQHFNRELPQAWASLVQESGAAGNDVEQQNHNQPQHVMAPQASGLKLVNDKLYINEIMQMVKFASAQNHTSEFVAANLDSLHSIGLRIGYTSRTYAVAKGALLDSIAALSANFDVTIVAVGTDHKIASDASRLLKRTSELDSVFATFGKRGAVAAKACFADQDSCLAATNGCSGHGSCTKVQPKCWQCVCSATHDKKSTKTTRWAGYDCSKKDIAAQAHLLLWTSVALLATLVAGIKLLFGVGSDALPGVLQAATIDTSR